MGVAGVEEDNTAITLSTLILYLIFFSLSQLLYSLSQMLSLVMLSPHVIVAYTFPHPHPFPKTL